MHTEKMDKLLQEFPDLFQRKRLIHGFECQDGWLAADSYACYTDPRTPSTVFTS